jgi:hypothetical protein
MFSDRRSVLSALALFLPFGLAARGRSPSVGPPPVLRFRPFEEAVREAFLVPSGAAWRRVEVGHAPALAAGVQGCHNDRPFAGFPAGHLRITQVGSGPGPAVGGVRLYVCTVDVMRTGGPDGPSRPLDFATLPAAPVLVSAEETDQVTRFGPI